MAGSKKFRRVSTYSKEFRQPGRQNLATGFRWWNPILLEQGSDAVADALCRDIMTIADRQQDREALQLLHYSLFGSGAQILGFGPNSYHRMTMESTERLTLNMVQSCVQAAKSKITKNKPRCNFSTFGADYELREKAENLQKYMDGIFYEGKAYPKGAMAFQDACVDGTGILHWYADLDDNICCERINPWEVTIDDAEYQHPDRAKTYQRRHFRDRYELACWACEIQKKHGLPQAWQGDDGETALYDAVMRLEPGADEARDVTIKATADLLLVYEGWRLPCPGEPSPTGRHVVATHEFVILDEPFEWNRFPMAECRWITRSMGYWGVGIAELLTGLQVEINTLLMQIQEGHHLIRGHYLVESGSEIIAAHINNDLANILTYKGIPPHYESPAIIAPEIYSHLQWLVAQCFETTGINQLTAQAQKPMGIDSGKALETMGDIQTDRFVDVGRNYEDLYMDSGEVVILLSKDIAKRKKSYGINARAKRDLVYIEWNKEVDMERDEFVMEVLPSSMLSSTPAARIQQVSDMMKNGLLDPDTGLDLLDFPDTEQYSRLRSGWRRCVEQDLAKIAREGVPVSPEPFYNIQGSIPLVRDALNDYRLRGLPEDRMKLIREYLVALTRLPAIQQQLIPSQMVANTQVPAPQLGVGPEAAGVGAPTNGAAGPAAPAPSGPPGPPPGPQGPPS